MQSIYTPLGSAVTDATQRSFAIGYGKERIGGRAIFNVQETDGLYTEVFNGGIMDNFARGTLDGGNFFENESIFGDELTITQAKFTSSVEITTGISYFDQYKVVEVLEGSENLGHVHSNRIEMDVQQHIKNGATGSYTNIDGDTVTVQSADGRSWFDGSHTVNGSASTYDNVDSTAFGDTGLVALGNLARNALNHDSQRGNKKPDTIFSTSEVANSELIKEYAISEGHPEDAFRGRNTWAGRYRHQVLEYLDVDTNGSPDAATDGYWGLIVANDENHKLRIGKNPMILPPKMTERSNNMLLQAEDWHAVGVMDANAAFLSQA
jgi:hypothetical protein